MRLLRWFLVLALLLCVCPAWGAVHRFAVIVGNNEGGRGSSTIRVGRNKQRAVPASNTENAHQVRRVWSNRLASLPEHRSREAR